jgi:hypothetical protein
MKKIFIVLSVLMALTLSAGSALAVGGAVDSVPGSDFVIPFLVSVDRVELGAGPTTYINVSEVGGMQTDYHLHFCNMLSVRIATRDLPITHWGSVMRDVAYYINNFSPAEFAGLSTVTLNGRDYYCGYIYAESRVWRIVTPGLPAVRVRGIYDNVICSMYLLDLAAGQAAASRVPMKEFYTANLYDAALQLAATGTGVPGDPFVWTSTAKQMARWAITGTSSSPTATGFIPVYYTSAIYSYLTVGAPIQYERFTPAALAAASNLTWGNAITTTNWVRRNALNQITATWNAPAVAWFRMFPEYYINSATGDTISIIWQNGLANGTDFHIYIINNWEQYADTTITINELTLLEASHLVPPAIMTGGYPYYGVMNFAMDDSISSTMDQVMWTEFLGWNWQFDNNGGGSGALNWSALKEMAREVGTSGTVLIPTHVQPALPI